MLLVEIVKYIPGRFFVYHMSYVIAWAASEMNCADNSNYYGGP